MQNNISEVKNKCFGCFSCFNVCPNNAIEMVANSEGFKYPVINGKCTNCGLCKKVCPHLIDNFENNKNPKCFAFMAQDDVRIKSSSGGVFPILAKHFIENGGYVAGAVYTENIAIHHIISNDINDIEKMRNSKYFQSNIDNCYIETKKLLDDEKLVLFTGTPCQIAGLKAFLKKDYDNLYCVDIICHGVPSPKVFRKYINEQIKNSEESWLHTNFRDKTNGLWSRLTTTTTTTTNSTRNDIFMKAFLSNLCLRETCSDCKFQTMPRQGDITMGDFWGIWKYSKKLNDEKGTSVVLKNNAKGDFLIKILKENSKVFKPVPLKYAINGNPCLVSSVKQNKDRKLFFSLLDNKKLEENVNICLNDNVDYLIVNFWDSYHNYGALITAYAMQELVKSYGYTTKLLDVGFRTNQDWFKDSFMEDFSKGFLHTTKKLNYTQCKELSKDLKGVILGSDQILRVDYMGYNLCKYLLNWIENDNTQKIALSASFGIDKEEFLSNKNYDSHVAEKMKFALSSFDYLSCREISGKEIFKDVFNLDSDWIFDPVFLIDKTKYDSIIEQSSTDYKNKIVSYVLDESEEYDNLYDYLAKKENSDIVKICRKSAPVEDWLKGIKECKLFITDSFHGVCFALIFNKPFICVRNKKRGNARFDTLVEYFDIENYFVSSIDDVYKDDYNYNMDFSSINQKIIDKRNVDLQTIRKILNENYSNNPNAKANKIKNSEYLKSINKTNVFKDFKIQINYTRCKLLANLTFGKQRKHYLTKKHNLKRKLKNQWN